MNTPTELQYENRGLLQTLISLVTPQHELDLSPIAKSIDDSSAQAICQLKDLRVLNLEGTLITQIQFLSSLKNLEVLNISNTAVDDLSVLTSLTSLKTLIAHDTPIYDLSPLSSLIQLKVLEMENTEVRDVGPLENLNQLESIDLGENKRIRKIEALGKLPKLKKLSLNQTGIVMPNQLSCLETLVQLEILNVDIDLEFAADAILRDIQQRRSKNFPPFFAAGFSKETIDTKESEKEKEVEEIYNFLKENQKVSQILARNPTLLFKVQERFLQSMTASSHNAMPLT